MPALPRKLPVRRRPWRSEGPLPVRAAGVLLIGEAKGSGTRKPPSLVRRADGQTIQLTRLLYLVLEAIDGQRGPEEIAGHASKTSDGWSVPRTSER